jgi:serine protease
MKRCLHITIHESLNAAQGPGTAYPFVRPGTDPETRDVAPDPDDPETRDMAPDPDDPSSSPYLSGGRYGHPGVTVHECGCAALPGPKSAAGSGKTAAPHPFVRPRDYSGFVVVRMAEGVMPKNSTVRSLWELAEEQKLAGLRKVLERAGKKMRRDPEAASRPPSECPASGPLVEIQKWGSEPVECDRSRNCIRELEEKAATTAFPPLHSLADYWRLDLREHPALAKKVVTRLNKLPEVDLAYWELAASDPSTAAGKQFAEDQGYLDDAPVGIGASCVWESLNGAAPKVTLCDLEQGWTPAHQDLAPHVPPSPLFGANRAADEDGSGHHGTAVLGQLAAKGNGPLGIRGAVAGLSKFVLASHYRSKTAPELPGTNGHVADAIMQALAQAPEVQSPPLQEGIILLLEVQRGLLPTEIDEADFDAIRLASALGVLVVEAAGNGGFDLDAYTDPVTGRSLRRGASNFRDSGAVLVGAARASLPHDRAPFSNYGSRVDCFGWGEAVTTCGYGDLTGTVDTDFYTSAFSGTSSASPIVAGAAALVQAVHQARTEFRLAPHALRALLSDPETGTRQGPNVAGHIGVMPDVEAIVRRRLQLVPDVYMRRHVGDHDSKPGRGEEISSSPDILLWKGNQQEAKARFGEGPGANDPAPGSPIDPSAPSKLYSGRRSNASNLYVRLRNRGVNTGKATVQLFASPAATLITPERWMPVDSVEIERIEQGDTLTLSPPVPVNLPEQWPRKDSEWPGGVVQAYSFLAVQLPSRKTPHAAPGYERTVILPPGPPYFDWAEYRSFLRGPDVTWRNVHAVKPGTHTTLSFLIAGTPDQSRRFDFEVIQRLPAGVKVSLEVSAAALAAKLRQRRPWLANGSGASLDLPRRPRMLLGPVALAPGVCTQAAFKVVEGTSPLLRGHSLAIRQLWRGEEVGRITWWFVDG